MKSRFVVLFALSIFCLQSLQAITVGSNSVVSLQSAPTFSGQDNLMLGFAWFKNGFTLQDSLTTCTFDDVYPVSGNINLNGGTLYLNQDLLFNDVTTLQGLGTIVCSNYAIDFCSSITWLPSGQLILQDVNLFLSADLAVTGSIIFQGNCVLIGDEKTVDLSDGGSIIVASDSSLKLRNVTMQGVSGANIQCADDTATLSLENIVWIQDDNYVFAAGALHFSEAVDMRGINTIFAYQSDQSCTIESYAIVALDQSFTFSYDPISASPDLLVFEDDTAQLLLNDATLHATMGGINLIHGFLRVVNNSFVASEVWTNGVIVIDNGVTFGDGSGADDFIVQVDSGAQLGLATGSMNYKNINGSSWIMVNTLSTLYLGVNTTLNLYQTLNLGVGVATFDNNTTLAVAPGEQLYGTINVLGSFNYISL